MCGSVSVCRSGVGREVFISMEASLFYVAHVRALFLDRGCVIDGT